MPDAGDSGAPGVVTSDMADSALAALLPPISRDAHKYTRGSLLVFAGSARFPGAAVLAAQAAARAGAGYVTLAVPEPAVAVAQAHLLSIPVLTAPAVEGAFAADAWESVRARLSHIDAIVLGPGITVTPSTSAFVGEVLEVTKGTVPRQGTVPVSPVPGSSSTRCVAPIRRTQEPSPVSEPSLLSPQPSPLRPPILLDADALNVLAALIAEGYGFDADSAVPAPAPHLILTPHAGELARLLEAAKATDAQQLARQLNAVVVAKGPETLIASPSRSHLFTAGTPALATAGTGDVLAGVIGAFAAQGVPPFDAAVLGVELHGRAGRHAEQHLGQRSVRAEDVTASLPLVLQHLER